MEIRNTLPEEVTRLRESVGAWMDGLLLGAVLVTAPLFLFPRARYMWVGVVLGAMLVARGVIWGRFLERTPLDWAIGGLGLMILATCFVVPDIEFSMGKIAGALYGILLYYAAVAVIRTERAIRVGIYAFILVGVALAVFGVVGTVISPEEAIAKVFPGIVKILPQHNWALPGAEAGINPNAVGGSLLWVALLAFFLTGAMWGKGKRVSANVPVNDVERAPGRTAVAYGATVGDDARGAGQEAEGTGGFPAEGTKNGPTETAEGGQGSRPGRTWEGAGSSRSIAIRPTRVPGLLLLSLASVIFLAALFLTHSYGVWIAMMLAVWLIGLNPKWKAWSLAGALVLYGAISGIGPLRRTIAPLMMAGTAGTGKAAPTDSVIPVKFEVRYGLWLAGAEAIRREPIFGVGMNRLRLDPSIKFKNAHAHNQFITTGAELGIPGLVAYIAILIGVGRMAGMVWRRSKDRWMKAAALGLIAGQAAFHIFGLGDAIPLGSKPNALFWVSLALITAIYRQDRSWPSGQCEEPCDEAIP